MRSQQKTYLTPEEYLAMERQAETKSEYLRGDVFALAGASEAHNLVVVNVVSALSAQLKSRPCKVYGSDMRVRVKETGLCAYPDASVVCGRAEFEDRQKDTLLNPTIIIEVLSLSTERYDRGAKFAHYRTLESLSDYVLIAQSHPIIEHYARQPDDKWLLSTYEGLEAVAPLPSIACELPLADIYDKVEWPEEDATITALRLVRDPAALYESEGGEYADRPGPPWVHR